MTCFVKEWLQLKGLEDLRGRGALELNTQHSDEAHREIHERDSLRIQYEHKERPTNDLQSPEWKGVSIKLISSR